MRDFADELSTSAVISACRSASGNDLIGVQALGAAGPQVLSLVWTSIRVLRKATWLAVTSPNGSPMQMTKLPTSRV